MLILLAPFILLVTSITMLVLRLTKPAFAYYWLVATSGALLAWSFSLISRLGLPTAISLPAWQPAALFPFSFLLEFDNLNWSLSIALSTLLLSGFLTKLARSPKSGERYRDVKLVNDLLITAISLLAVLAGNFLTLIMLWVALDMMTLFIWIKETNGGEQNLLQVIPFSMNALGILLIILAGITSQSTGMSVDFNHITSSISPFLLIACGARLAVIPLSPIINTPMSKPRGLSIVVRISPIAATLMPLIRIGTVGAPPTLQPILLLLAAIAAIFSAISWLNSPDETNGLPYWILGISALAFSSSVRSQVSASFAWSIILLLPGSLLFLFSARQRWITPIFFLSFLGVSTLPFTPAWSAIHLYALPFQPITLILLFAQSILLFGYLKHGLRGTYPLSQAERWVWVIYPLGLIIIPLVQFGIAWWNRTGNTPTLIESWPALFSSLMVLLLLFWKPSNQLFSKKGLIKIVDFLSFRWFYDYLNKFYLSIQKLFSLINRGLEGNGSILWALVILALLMSLFIQVDFGGF